MGLGAEGRRKMEMDEVFRNMEREVERHQLKS